MEILRSDHPADLTVMQAVVKQAQEIQGERDEHLAKLIAEKVGSLFKK